MADEPEKRAASRTASLAFAVALACLLIPFVWLGQNAWADDPAAATDAVSASGIPSAAPGQVLGQVPGPAPGQVPGQVATVQGGIQKDAIRKDIVQKDIVQKDVAQKDGNQKDPPALSPQCEVPAADLALPVPLPNLAKALAAHRLVRILAIGSASLAGLGEAAGVKSYPVQITDILQAALAGVSVEIINRGAGGEVAETTADRIRSEIAVTKPDLVLWQLGTNDALARIDPGEFSDVVRRTIGWLRANDIDVVLVGLQYTTRFAKDENYIAIREALQQIAAEEKVLYVRRYDAMRYIAQTRANLHLMANDNYHLSNLGTQCMAEHIARAMIASLFVKRFRPAPE